jgi:uncharacterized protein (TIGR02301 family)
MRSVAVAAVVGLLALTPSAMAQQNRGGAGRAAQPPAPPQPPPPPAPVEQPTAPYEKELLRLSEIIGSLAFLRTLCAASDAPEWQKRMQALIDSESTSSGRRERLAGAYNRGYRGYALTYRVCTPSATEATARYLKEGDQLSRGLAGRFGG